MISIIIPVYNAEKTLARCLTSVFAQTYTDKEVIVVDDGSKNSTEIKNILKQFPVDKYLQQNNQGAPAARNNGFAKSRGDYVLFLDADIVMQPDMLAKLLQALEDNPQAAFAYSQFKHGWKKFHAHEFDISFLQKQNYIHTAALLRRESFPGFDETLQKFQDWDVWLTIVEQGGAGVFVPEVLFQIIDMHGTMSSWVPSLLYKLPWPILGYTPQVIQKYFKAQEKIFTKHNLA